MATITDEELARYKAIESHAWHLLNVDSQLNGARDGIVIPADSIHHRELRDLLDSRLPPRTVVTEERIRIDLKSDDDVYHVQNLARKAGIWLQVENFDLRVARTDFGLRVSIFDKDREEGVLDPIIFMEVDDEMTHSFQGAG